MILYNEKIFKILLGKEECENYNLDQINANLNIVTEYIFNEKEKNIFDNIFCVSYDSNSYRNVAAKIGTSHEYCRRTIEICLSLLKKEPVLDCIINFDERIEKGKKHLPIEFLRIGLRLIKILNENNIFYIDELLNKYDYHTLLSLKRIGVTCSDDVLNGLKRLNIENNFYVDKCNFKKKRKEVISSDVVYALKRIMKNNGLTKEQLLTYVQNLQE